MLELLPTATHFALMLQRALHFLLLLCVLRGLPFVVYAFVGAQRSPRYKAVLVTGYVALTVVTELVRGDHSVLQCAVGWAYYLAGSSLVPTLARLLRNGRITGLALFVLFAMSFLLLPGLSVPGGSKAVFLVLGWDLLLSSYSYCHDVARSDGEPSRGQCLFFLLVDPTLVYHQRSRYAAEPSGVGQGLGRAGLGLGVMFVAAAVLGPAYAWISGLLRFALGADETLAVAVAFGVTRFLAEYAAHSGLASFQIGLMRHHGYAPPERYRRPFMAKDPLDFWRRWNTYVAAWLKHYVFVPTARRLRKVALPVPAGAVALVVTFAASGLLHDGYFYAIKRFVLTRGTEFFLANALMVVAWVAAGRVSKRMQARVSPALRRTVSRLLFVGSMLGACFIWG